MQVADECTEWHVIGNALNGEGSFLWIGNIVEHFQDPSNAQDEHEEDSSPTCAQRVSPAGLCSWDRWRMEVVKKGGAHGLLYKPPASFGGRFILWAKAG